MQRIIISFIFLFSFLQVLKSQPDRWQQKIAYVINVNMNVSSNRFSGTEQVDYWNNSPDTLHRLFFHLYWNAFQPGSMMDVRSRELGKIVLGTDKNGDPVNDWDPRVTDRISKLTPAEIGFDSVDAVKVNGVNQQLIYHETILEVALKTPLLPHSKSSLQVSFRCQVPLQVRRSGRDNAEGVRYSMSQWYPKMVEYDYEGWNANPYIAREFYGVWGSYDVNITIDKNFLLAGTGTIQNPNEVGYGYQAGNVKIKAPAGSALTWKFSAQNVHDFVWAADTAYAMIKKQIPGGPLLYFVYKKSPLADNNWQQLADKIEKAFPYIQKNFGAYAYKNYSFIQGGDGGMEYPMATLLKNTGAAIHELMHSWYQGMLGNNESLYAWMDEGFATYAETKINAWLRNDSDFIFQKTYDSYFNLVKSGREEPLSTHADHFNTNYAYSVASYSKGCIFLSQLGYIVGDSVLNKILLQYYNEWHFKHPNPNDFIRVAENVSGLELQWYKQYWVYTTKTVDYALGAINNNDGKAEITIKRLGLMPMPADVEITYKDSSRETYYVPLNLMYGSKTPETKDVVIKEEWKWVNPEYVLRINKNVSDIKSIEIDPTQRIADINRINNKIVIP